MKLHKLFTLGLLSTFMLASCDNVEEPVYTPAESVANPDACFKMGDNTTVQLKEDQSSIEVTVYRKSGEGKATFPIQASDVAPVYTTYPTEVVFEDGQLTTTFSVGVDFEKVVPLEKYNITFSLPGVSNTDYYLGAITYTCFYEPWKVVTGPNGETTARWRDDIVFNSAYGLPAEYQEWDVTIEQSPNDPGVYRIQNPYRCNEFFTSNEFVDMSDDLYIYFNMTDPEKVYFCDKDGKVIDFANTGVTVNPADGLMTVGSYANLYLSQGKATAADDYGKFRNGNLTWGVKKMLICFSESAGDIYYANTGGMFRIVWPGFEPAEDPANTWTTIGEAEFTDGWIMPLIGKDAQTVAVNVQQNGANPDFYRLVDPFMYVLGQPSEGIFMYLDCTNHDNVLMPLQENITGLVMEGASLYATNMAEIYMNWMSQPLTEEDIIENGLNSTFDGTTITVPAQNVAVAGATNGSLGILTIEKPADGKIVLPSAEQTAAYKKAQHRQKFVAPSERRKIAIDNLFKGKIVPIKNIGALKNLK